MGCLTLLLAPACGDVASASAPGDDAGHDALHVADAAHDASHDAPRSDDVAPPPCVTPVLDASCSMSGTVGPTLCSEGEPANPCSTGFIWGCNGAWYHEEVTCHASDGTTVITTPCPAGELLFVDDVAGDPCTEPADGSGSGAAMGCPTGTYPWTSSCCEYPTNAYCVPTPASCGQSPSCACANPICGERCGGGGVDNGVYCASVSASVLDCFCGKG